MSIIDAVKRIEREGDPKGNHVAKLVASVGALTRFLSEHFSGYGTDSGLVSLPKGYAVVHAGHGHCSRLVKDGRAIFDEGVGYVDLLRCHELAMDVAAGWLDLVATELELRGGTASWDAGIIQAAVNAAKGGSRD